MDQFNSFKFSGGIGGGNSRVALVKLGVYYILPRGSVQFFDVLPFFRAPRLTTSSIFLFLVAAVAVTCHLSLFL